VRLVVRLLVGLFLNLAFVWAALLVIAFVLARAVLLSDYVHPELADREFQLPGHFWAVALWPAAAGVVVALLAVARRFRKDAWYRRTVWAATFLFALCGALFFVLLALPS
jgi:hypothetical protein